MQVFVMYFGYIKHLMLGNHFFIMNSIERYFRTQLGLNSIFDDAYKKLISTLRDKPEIKSSIPDIKK